MTPEDYDATAPGKATRALDRFMLSAGWIAVGSEIGGVLTNVVGMVTELGAKKYPDNERLAAALEANDRHHQAGMRKGILVIGVWSAFEAWVEDFTRGLMHTDRNWFEGKSFGNFTVTSGHLNTDDGRDEAWAEIEKRLNRKLFGIDRYEDLFTNIGLSGDVLGSSSVDIRPPFTNAFAIRNVWAHNAGYADAKFVERSSGLNFTMGNLVDLRYDQQFQLYMLALIIYPMVVANRHREPLGAGPVPLTGKLRDTSLGQAYVARYPGA